jgi:hypothetical protein
MSYSDSVIQAESGGDPNSKDPNSSASGPAGFINSTFLDVVRRHFPEIAQGKSDADILALKTDPALAGQAADAYAADNAAILSRAGLPVTDGSKYLAHFAGPQGAVKILQADPNAPATDILGPAAAKANPFLAGMTAQGLQAWAAKKAGVTLPAGGQGPQGTPQPGAQPQAALQAPTLPQQRPPIFAQPAAGGAASPAQAYADPMPAAAPIFAAQQRPHIDLSGLQAALTRQRAPIFARTS